MSARTLLALAVLACAVPAAADEPGAAATKQAAPPPAATSPSPPERARVRASHRVDVIAPGDRVETVIDRLRASRPPSTAGDARSSSADRPVRGPDGRPPVERPGEHGQHGQPGHPGQHGMPGGPSPPGGTGATPDHHHR
jgi:hypothetical protein